MANRILPLMRKENLHILRDPRSLYLAIGLPVILVILFGYAITMNVSHIHLGIIDQDSTSLCRDLIFRLGASDYFDIIYQSNSFSGSEKLLDDGRVKILIGIPSGFSKDLIRGANTPLQLLIDGSDNNTAQIALGYISSIVRTFSLKIILDKLNKQGPVPEGIPPMDVEPIVWFNPDLRSTNFIVPGLIAVIMMVLSAMLTSLTIAREWENGTMEQLISSPAKPIEIITGKLIPYFVLGMFQTLLIILVGTLLFRVPLKGNLLFLFFITAVFLVCGLGTGLLISTVTKSQQLAFMISIIFTLLPSFLLSGFIFSISSMPKVIQIISYLVPAKYFLTVLRGIFLKGNGLAVLWPEVVPLILLALLVIMACVKRLKLTLE